MDYMQKSPHWASGSERSEEHAPELNSPEGAGYKSNAGHQVLSAWGPFM